MKNAATGQSTEIQADVAANYNLSNLQAGEYEISVTAEGLGTKVAKVSLAAGARKTFDAALQPRQAVGERLHWPISAFRRLR